MLRSRRLLRTRCLRRRVLVIQQELLVSYRAVVDANQGWKCVLGLKAKPLRGGVVRINHLLRGSVDVLGSIKVFSRVV